MAGRIKPRPFKGQTHKVFIGQCFKRSTALGDDIDKGGGKIHFGQNLGCVIGIDIGNETNFSPWQAVGFRASKIAAGQDPIRRCRHGSWYRTARPDG